MKYSFRRCSTERWRRPGFTLTEVLTGVVLLALLGLILAAGHRWLLLLSERSSRWLLARDRGQRVIAFIEPRVLHCGLGLSACRGEGALQRALGQGAYNAPTISRWSGPNREVRVYNDKPSWPTPAKEEDGVLRGTGFSVIYGRPSGLVVKTQRGGPLALAPGETAEFDVLAGDASGLGFRPGVFQDLRSWAALPLTGTPLHIVSAPGRRLSLRLAASASLPLDIPPVNELALLRCERFRAINGTFCFQGMEIDWYPPNFYPREEGVLALWIEWRRAGRTLDLWVLTTGGAAVFGPTARPAAWPQEAPWNEDFGQRELCVSRASWKLENL